MTTELPINSLPQRENTSKAKQLVIHQLEQPCEYPRQSTSPAELVHGEEESMEAAKVKSVLCQDIPSHHLASLALSAPRALGHNVFRFACPTACGDLRGKQIPAPHCNANGLSTETMSSCLNATELGDNHRLAKSPHPVQCQLQLRQGTGCCLSQPAAQLSSRGWQLGQH